MLYVAISSHGPIEPNRNRCHSLHGVCVYCRFVILFVLALELPYTNRKHAQDFWLCSHPPTHTHTSPSRSTKKKKIM